MTLSNDDPASREPRDFIACCKFQSYTYYPQRPALATNKVVFYFSRMGTMLLSRSTTFERMAFGTLIYSTTVCTFNVLDIAMLYIVFD